jgi:hypothetical protein
VSGKRIQELRSLAYHRAVASRLLSEPHLVSVARERVERWRNGGELHPDYARAWQTILERPLDEIVAFVVADTDESRDLRHVSPFAGFLDYRERLRIWREVRSAQAS